LRADLYPRVYFPDLTTSARRDEMDSLDLVALDFLVGAIDRFLDGNVSGSLEELNFKAALATNLTFEMVINCTVLSKSVSTPT
jgi:hypothetical protein